MAPQDMGDMPLGLPPPGVDANFEHPASKKSMEIAVLSVIAPITTLVFVLRVYAKAFVQRNFDASDWTCVIGFIVTIAYSYTLFHLAVIPGVGNHSYELHVKDVPASYYSNNIASGILLAVSLLFIKLSILLLVTYLFWVRQIIRFLMYAAISITVIVYVIYVIMAMYFCVPRHGETAMSILVGQGTKRCLHIFPLSSVLAGFNAVSDLIILCIAVTVIMTLQTSFGRRIRASALFILGLAATGLSICNAYYRIANNSKDPTWDYTTLFILTYYEICLGMICACLPCLPLLSKSPFIKRVMDSRIFSTLGSFTWTRSRTSTDNRDVSGRQSGNSSTTGLAQKDSETNVAITRTIEVENSYELQQNGFKRDPEWQRV